MATTAIPGFSGQLFASTAVAATSAPASTLVAELQDVTLSFEMAEMAATSKDSAAWEEFLPGLRRWGAAGKGLYHDVIGTSSGSTGQSYLEMSILGRTNMGVTFRTNTSSGILQYSGGAIVTKFDIVDPLAAPAEYNFTLRGTGALTQSVSTS